MEKFMTYLNVFLDVYVWIAHLWRQSLYSRAKCLKLFLVAVATICIALDKKNKL